MKIILFLLSHSLFAFALNVTNIINQYIIQKSSLSKISNFKVIENLGNETYLIETPQLLSLNIASPNRLYQGNPIEGVQDTEDPQISNQFHHEIISSNKIWNFSNQSENEVIIAVTDNGFDLEHPDLIGGWWQNKKEIPNNNIDDDNNGYIDDVQGWDFITKTNSPTPKGETSHGTHVAGLIMAQRNKIGVRGVTPNIKVMPLRFFATNQKWSSAIVVKAYYYAIDNGAQIISTSYNIDPFVDDPAYINALEYAKQKNILIINSAGNSHLKNPKRGKLHYPILVCGTQSNPKKKSKIKKISKFSNYGEGIDICAPSEKIYSTFKRYSSGNPRYGVFKGTSMSTPLVASVAAFYLQEYPQLTVEELKEYIYKTTIPIDGSNKKKYKNGLGHGLLDLTKLQID